MSIFTFVLPVLFLIWENLQVDNRKIRGNEWLLMTHFNKFALRVAPVAASVLGVYYLVDTFKLTRSLVKSNYVGRSQVLGSQLWNSYSLNGGIIPKMLVTFNAGLSFDTKVYTFSFNDSFH